MSYCFPPTLSTGSPSVLGLLVLLTFAGAAAVFGAVGTTRRDIVTG